MRFNFKISILLLTILLNLSFLTFAQVNKKIVLQGFWWNFKNTNYPQGWANYLVDLTPRLRRMGIDAVWVPVSSKNANPQSNGYSPFDHYDLGEKWQKSNLKTPLGDKDEFLRMIGIMHRNGIDVLQDVVLNHIDGAGSSTSQGAVDSASLDFYRNNRPNSNYQDIVIDPTGGNKNFRYVSYVTPATNETKVNYLARSGRWPKNWQNFNPGPGDNRFSGDDLSRITFGPDIAFYPNARGLATESTYNPVQESDYMRIKAREWMIWFKKQTGVDGYRLDAIKHFPNSITEDMLWNVQNNAGFASGTDQMLAIGEWVGGKSELDDWVSAVQNRAGTFDFGLRGFSSGPGLYAMVYGFGNYDLSNLPGLQQNSRDRTAPFVNNHDTFRPNAPNTGTDGLDSAGNYPVNLDGSPKRWFSSTELATNIDPREPRLTAAYAVAFSVDGHPNVFFEDLFDIGTKGNRYTHLPQSDTGLPVRQSIANLIKCHKKFDFKSGAYRVRSSEATAFFDGSSAQNAIVFERSGKAIIAVTDNFTTDQAVWIDCDFAVGTVLKDYTSNFPNVTVVTRQVGAGGRVRVIAPKCNGAVNNTINKGVAIYAPASLESFFNQPFPISDRTTTHEWELANDLGDSDPRSLRQGGALPANSTATRWAGKVYAQAGKPITYKLFPSFPTRDLTMFVTNECGAILDSVKGIGELTKTYTPTQTTWYQFRAKNSLDTNREQRVWVNVTYTGPDSINALAVKSRILPFVELGPDRFGCIGSNVNLNATFGPGLSYVWRDSLGIQIGTNPNISLNRAGRFSVTLTDPQNGCTTSDRIRIISFETPPPAGSAFRVGDTLTVINITPGVRYGWRINGVTNPGDTLTYLTIPANAITVNLISRNAFNCQNVTSNLITSVQNLLEDDGSVKIFPNPAKDFLTIEYAGNRGVLKTTLIDLKGVVVREDLISGGESVSKSLSLKGLKPGLYLVKIQNGLLFRTAKLSIQ